MTADKRRAVAESDYRFMVDAMADEVLMLDREGRILTWNPGAQSLKGYTAAEVIGKDVSMFYTEEDRQAGLARRELQTALATGRFQFEGWRVKKDGERFWADVVLTPMRDESGEHIGFVKFARDLTERVERERLVQKQRDEIMQLSTPVIQVWDRVLALPIIGTLDSQRAQRLTENLLQKISDEEAAIIIIDISGVPAIDSQVAQHLMKTIDGARLMGAESIISGVRPETAQAMVHLGVNIGNIRSRATLRDALQLAIRLQTQSTTRHDAA